MSRSFPLNAWYAAAWSHEIEHELAARTDNNRVVNFKGNPRQIGHFLNLKITAALPHSLRGEVCIAE